MVILQLVSNQWWRSTTINRKYWKELIPPDPKKLGICLIAVFGSSLTSDKPNDLDLLIVTTDEPSKLVLDAVREARSSFASIAEMRVEVFLMKSGVLWEKMVRGDLQIVGLFRNIHVLYEAGLGTWLASLVAQRVIATDLGQAPRLRQFAVKCLDNASSELHPSAQRLSALRAAVRSGLQYLLLERGVEPGPPDRLIEQLAELDIDLPNRDVHFEILRKFELRVRQLAAAPASIQASDVVQWLVPVRSFLSQLEVER